MALRLATFTGRTVAPLLPDLARLCTIVFREWPHLYDGDGTYDETHLQALVQSPRSALVAAYDGNTPVGAATCLPLGDATPNVQAPFLAAGLPVSQYFYFAESVLLPAYRGHQIGRSFFGLREAHARAVSDCTLICFCTVQRPDDHPARPANAHKLDSFWRRQGYTPAEDLHCSMMWREIGQPTDSRQTLMFWTKPQSASDTVQAS
jgi:Acetyltransferase (GNAT) family